jgi:hypothetical protein
MPRTHFLASGLFDSRWYRALSWLLVAAYLALLFHGLHVALPLLPAWIVRGEGLLVRFLQYNLLAFLVANAVSRGGQKRRFWAAFAAGSCAGALGELHRHLVLGSGLSFSGWLLAVAGSWAGAYLYLKSERLWRDKA